MKKIWASAILTFLALSGAKVWADNEFYPDPGAGLATQATLADIDSKLFLGQQDMAHSLSVVLASGQTVTGTFTNASVGLNGATAPTSSTQIAGVNISGNLIPVPITASGGLKVDNSGVTQPITGSVTANAGTNLNTSLLALESGGHLASIDTKLTFPLAVNSTLQAGSAIVGKVGIDQTSPGTTNGVQINAALPTGTNSIGQVTANAGTNLNTSLLATAANQTNGTQVTALIDGLKTSYSASVAFVPVTGATDVFCIAGSGTKTIRVNFAEFSFTKTTAADVDVQLIKRSTADTGGTGTTQVDVQHDTTDAAGTATVISYTANPTLGTVVAAIRSQRILVGTTANPTQVATWDFGRISKAIVLRGTAQQICFNLGGVAIAGGNADGSFEWTEE